MNFPILVLLAAALGVDAASAPQSNPCSCANPLVCKNFIGLNQCGFRKLSEPSLPPLANTCCGPTCSYAAPNSPGVCSNVLRGFCILDTTCCAGPPFQYRQSTGCDIQAESNKRIAKGYPPLLLFNFTKEICKSYNKKCGINCCCRETCPKQFCTLGRK